MLKGENMYYQQYYNINIEMMSYVSKAVNKAVKVSKNMIKGKRSEETSQVLELLRSLYKKKEEILPLSKMNKLAVMSYEIQHFQQIKNAILNKLQEKNFSKSEKIIRVRNLLIITGYLIKHGAGGFVDEFRDSMMIFKYFYTYEYAAYLEEDLERRKKISNLWEEVRNRAAHVLRLLEDKEKLLREKELAMMVKQKMKLYGQENRESNMQQENSSEKKGMKQKVESFIENYVWHYVDKIDGKIESAAEVIAGQIEKYLLEEVPESFEIDQVEIDEVKLKSQVDLAVSTIKREQNYMLEKNEDKREKKQEKTVDLLSL